MTELLKLNLEREKTLKELKEDPKENGKEINKLLVLIRNDYRLILVETPLVSSQTKRDIDGLLWKQCYYKQIEEYRRSIKKTSGMISDPASPSAIVEKAQAHLVKLTAAFLKFLTEAITGYQELMLQLDSKYNSLPEASLAERHALLLSVHRCLLYLGDLSRYRILHTAEQVEKDYAEPERYYERAAFIYPASGNPHNQFAVLATYSDMECMAMYHYCRSILCDQPFAGCVENLSLLFDKNAKTFQQVSGANKQRLLMAAVAGANPQDRRKREVDIKIKLFLINFVRLHGMLFLWARRVKQAVVNNGSSSVGTDTASAGVALVAPVNFDEWDLLLRDVLGDLDELLLANAFGDYILVRLILVGLFSVHYASLPSLLGDEKSQGLFSNPKSGAGSSEGSEHPRIHSTAESMAVAALFGMINKVSTVIYRITSAADRSRKASPSRLLSSLFIFAEWATVHSHYLHQSAALPSSAAWDAFAVNHPALSSRVAASPEVLRAEARARSGMRSVLTILQDYLTASLTRQEQAGHFSPQSLAAMAITPCREHIELRGFLPLRDHLETFFDRLDPLAKYPPASLSDDAAKVRKLRVLCDFIRDCLIPLAEKETKEASALRALAAKAQADSVEVSKSLRAAKGSLLGQEKSKRRDRGKNKDRDSDQPRGKGKDTSKAYEKVRDKAQVAADNGKKTFKESKAPPGNSKSPISVKPTSAVGGQKYGNVFTVGETETEDPFPPLPSLPRRNLDLSVKIPDPTTQRGGEDEYEDNDSDDGEDSSGGESGESEGESTNDDVNRTRQQDDRYAALMQTMATLEPALLGTRASDNVSAIVDGDAEDLDVDISHLVSQLQSRGSYLNVGFGRNDDNDNDDDLDDDVVLFRPAFAPLISATPPPPMSPAAGSVSAMESTTIATGCGDGYGYGGFRLPQQGQDQQSSPLHHRSAYDSHTSLSCLASSTASSSDSLAALYFDSQQQLGIGNGNSHSNGNSGTWSHWDSTGSTAVSTASPLGLQREELPWPQNALAKPPPPGLGIMGILHSSGPQESAPIVSGAVNGAPPPPPPGFSPRIGAGSAGLSGSTMGPPPGFGPA